MVVVTGVLAFAVYHRMPAPCGGVCSSDILLHHSELWPRVQSRCAKRCAKRCAELQERERWQRMQPRRAFAHRSVAPAHVVFKSGGGIRNRPTEFRRRVAPLWRLGRAPQCALESAPESASEPTSDCTSERAPECALDCASERAPEGGRGVAARNSGAIGVLDHSPTQAGLTVVQNR
jgi:hypothetical protein